MATFVPVTVYKPVFNPGSVHVATFVGGCELSRPEQLTDLHTHDPVYQPLFDAGSIHVATFLSECVPPDPFATMAPHLTRPGASQVPSPHPISELKLP